MERERPRWPGAEWEEEELINSRIPSDSRTLGPKPDHAHIGWSSGAQKQRWWMKRLVLRLSSFPFAIC